MPVRVTSSRIAATAMILVIAVMGCRREAPAPQPARIIGGSMGAGLAGEHINVTCGDCGFGFRCGIEHPPARGLAVCPNCGYAQNDISDAKLQPGREAAVLARDFSTDPPRRGEIIAFGEPGNASVIAVKRIVGLPGETVAIRGGDFFVGGRRLQKSLAELQVVAQPVYDDAYRPKLSPELPRRWAADSPKSRWEAIEGGFRFVYIAREEDGAQTGTPGGVPRAEVGRSQTYPTFDYLRYSHWLCAEDTARRAQPSPVLDDYAYDQGLARPFNAVGDLLLTCRVRWLDGDPLAVEIHDGHRRLMVVLDQSQNLVTLVEISEGTGDTPVPPTLETLAEAPSATPLVGDWFALAVAVCDGRVLVGINGQPTMTYAIEGTDAASQPVPRPLAIGASRASIEIRDLRVLRDLYYLDPNGRGDDWQIASPLAADEYFLVGDNVPSSRDSRHFGPVRRAALLGIVSPLEGP
jgi:signal peptidase I